jgi:hypothetical protein
MKLRFGLLCLAVAALFGVRADAHHPYVVAYVENETQTIEGTLIQMILRNPHSFVLVMAPDANRAMQRWVVEWRANGQLAAAGVTPNSLSPGDVVRVTGNPGRYPADHRIRMKSIARPSDGWEWHEPR